MRVAIAPVAGAADARAAGCDRSRSTEDSNLKLRDLSRPWARARGLGGAALLCALVLGACGEPEAALEPGRTQFGFNEDPGPGSFELQATLAMPVRRFPVPWSSVQADPERWVWTRFDARYERALSLGLRPLLVAIGAPCWARATGPACEPGSAGVPAAGLEPQWAEYVRRLAGRYPRALGVEVWNEPNITSLFPPAPDPVRFTTLLQAAHAAVKSADPEMPVISGGLFPSAVSGSFATADSEFLEAMLAAGAAESLDGIGAHPYPTGDGTGAISSEYRLVNMELALARLRSVRDEHGDDSIPIWITEMGLSTESAAGFPAAAAEAEQSELLLEMIETVDASPDVPVALVHRLTDVEPGSSPSSLEQVESGFGVFRSDGSPKPAACELSQVFGGTLEC